MRALSLFVLASLLLAGCPADDNHFMTDGGRDGIAPTSCTNAPAGTIICTSGNTATTCDGHGGMSGSMDCGSQRCVQNVGCRQCVPNQRSCDSSGVPQLCNADGMGYTPQQPCAGAANCSNGVCVDLCAEARSNHSYIGCEYWAVTTSNSQLGGQVDPSLPAPGTAGFPFAIAVANPQSVPAQVHIAGGALTAARTQTVAPGALEIINLPWVQAVAQVVPAGGQFREAQSILASGGGYNITSSVPVTVYQFNPLSYRDVSRSACATTTTRLDCFSFTNDASLLLPTSVLTGHYTVASWPTSGLADMGNNIVYSSGGFLTIVATAADTNVTIHLAGASHSGPGLPATPAGGTITQTLQAGDVLEILSAPVTSSSCMHDSEVFTRDELFRPYYACRPNRQLDLTGSIIESDQPIAVFAGHDCAQVPYNRAACDHLEEELFPNETLGTHYMVSRTQPQLPMHEPNLVRIVSNSANNMLTFNPPGIHAPVTLARGEYVDFEQPADFEVNGSGPYAVSQFFVGQNYFGNDQMLPPGTVGDPSMVLEVPVEQWRTSYEFLAPDTYPISFVNVTAQHGASITLDGQPIGAPATMVGAFDVYRLDISTRTGAHHIESTSTQTFGIKVYGFGSDTSYMYPGGLDLTQISPPG